MSEKLEPLYGGLTFLHPDGLPRPGADAYLLADFYTNACRTSGGSVADLGTGTGIIPVLLARSHARTVGYELNPALADAARDNLRRNGLKDAEIVRTDLRELDSLPRGEFDAAVCNPPYFAGDRKSPDPSRAAARNDETLTIADACRAASRILKPGGTFCFVYRPERVADALEAARGASLEPKILRFVSHERDKEPFVFLCAAVRNGNRGGTRVLPPLFLASDTAETDRIYHRG